MRPDYGFTDFSFSVRHCLQMLLFDSLRSYVVPRHIHSLILSLTSKATLAKRRGPFVAFYLFELEVVLPLLLLSVRLHDHQRVYN